MKQNIETLELRCEEMTKQIDEITQDLETEKRKTERLRETATNDSPATAKVSAVSKLRHTSSASEPENEEVCRNYRITRIKANFLSIRLQRRQIQ